MTSAYKTFPLQGAANISLLILDVDGVLTNGRIILGNNGEEFKGFNVRDGHGIKLAQRAGIQVGILTGRSSGVVQVRAEELGIRLVVQGSKDKREGLDHLLNLARVEGSACAFMGDDVVDLPAMRACGFSMAPADAHHALRNHVDWISDFTGGDGAVRQAVEGLILATGAWCQVMDVPYGLSPADCGWPT